MAIRKKAATSDTTKINVAVISEHLKNIEEKMDKGFVNIDKKVSSVETQFITLNGKVQRHESSLAIINDQDLEVRLAKQEGFRYKAIGGLSVLAAINIVFLVLNYIHQIPKP